MSAGNVTNGSKAGFLQRNWFTICIAILLVFLLIKKDLSFSINMRAPAPQNQEETEAPRKRAKKEKSTELMTDAQPTKESSESERLDVSFFGSKSQPKATDQLKKLDDATIQAYLKRFARVAVSESGKFGIPASIILANATLLSYAGQRDIASQGNNHFALPCTSDWKGATEEIGEKCYRKYDNAWTSFRDNSFYMTTGRMASLKDLKNKDYKTWAKALEKADYNEEPNFSNQLVKVIEKYGLTKLDE